MIRYKFDVYKALCDKGYTAARMKETKFLSQSAMTSLKNGDLVSLDTINTICLLLRLQPGDIVESVYTDEEKIKYF